MEPRTLILTPSWMPHDVASWQQAVTLLYTSKADVIESYDAEISSPSTTIRVPAVMRLRELRQTHKGGVKFSRTNVYQRDGFRCCYCGERKRPRELNYDHVVPRHQGGRTDWLNIVSACYVCNGRKRNRTPAEAGMRMHFQPKRPTHLQHMPPAFLATDELPEQWLPYVETLRRGSA